MRVWRKFLLLAHYDRSGELVDIWADRWVEECSCAASFGSAGGCCAVCGGAVLTDQERGGVIPPLVDEVKSIGVERPETDEVDKVEVGRGLMIEVDRDGVQAEYKYVEPKNVRRFLEAIDRKRAKRERKSH